MWKAISLARYNILFFFFRRGCFLNLWWCAVSTCFLCLRWSPCSRCSRRCSCRCGFRCWYFSRQWQFFCFRSSSCCLLRCFLAAAEGFLSILGLFSEVARFAGDLLVFTAPLECFLGMNNILFITIYRSLVTDENEFMIALNSYLESVTMNSISNHIILRDININIASESEISTRYMKLLGEFNFTSTFSI